MATENLGQVSAIYIGATQPTNTNLIWRDTTEDPQVWKTYNTLTGQWEELSTGSGLDEKVKVSSNDTTPDFLLSKLVFGGEFESETENPSENENILLKFRGWVYNTGRTFYHSLTSLATQNRAISLPDKDGTIALLDDISGGGLTIPSQTPIAIADGATTDIVLENTGVFYSFADGNTAWTVQVSGGSDTEEKVTKRYIDNTANNSAVIITLSNPDPATNADMKIYQDDGNNLTIAANSMYELQITSRSSTAVGMFSLIPLK